METTKLGVTPDIKSDDRAVRTFQDLFQRQKAFFATDATKSYEWRIDQLDRLVRMLSENEKRFQEAAKADFKTALPEHVFEVAASVGSIQAIKAQLADWMKPGRGAYSHVPRRQRAQGHRLP
jgi:aldehyde dehydrogenase (NAD+)